MFKRIINLIKFHKNSKKLINTCYYYADQYENDRSPETKIIPSCKRDLMIEIRKRINNDKEGVAKLNEYTDWDELANANIYNASFDLLVSGEYHIYYGQLNPMKCTYNLMLVCNSSLKWALNSGTISQEDFDKQIQCLMEGIRTIG